jgi:hypothetical protein
MLMAYEDMGEFRIKDVPADDPRVPLYPINYLSKAAEIREWAKNQGDDFIWKIEGKGPYRVSGNPR